MTRIVAGSARGRRLKVPPQGTRPTADRVREAMFSRIDSALLAAGRSWTQLDVLDLFAGSGALGLEAASRGARRVTLVEQSRPAVVILRGNAEAVGRPDVEIVAADVRRLGARPGRGEADLVLADPPYDWTGVDVASVLSRLQDLGWVAPRAEVVVERPAKDPDPPVPADWEVTAQRAYGDTALWYGRANPRTLTGPKET